MPLTNTTAHAHPSRAIISRWIWQFILLGIITVAGFFCYHAIASKPFQPTTFVLPAGIIVLCIFWLSSTPGRLIRSRWLFLCLNTAFILLYIFFSYFQFIQRPIDIFALSGSFFIVPTLLYGTINTCIPTIGLNWRRLYIFNAALISVTLGVSLYANPILKPLDTNQLLILLGALVCYLWLIFRPQDKSLSATTIFNTNKGQQDEEV